MAGYNGYSKSNNAVGAESAGRFPMTQAARIVANDTGVTIKTAKSVLWAVSDHEWHHTSKHYNATGYYNTVAAIAAINLSRELGLDLTPSFFAAWKAYGLTDVICVEEVRPLERLNNPGEYDSGRDEFIEDVKNGNWL